MNTVYVIISMFVSTVVQLVGLEVQFLIVLESVSLRDCLFSVSLRLSIKILFCFLAKALVFARGRHATLRDAASDSMRESGESILL